LLRQGPDTEVVPLGDDGRLAEGPTQVGVAQLGAAQAFDLAGAGDGPFDQATVGQEVFDRGEALDFADFIEARQDQRFSPGALGGSLQDTVREIDKDQPVSAIRPLEHWIFDSISNRRFQMLLLAAFAGVALALAAVGIYGVTAYVVSQRTREIGIRVALGAQSFAILGLVIRHGIGLTMAGVLIGLGGALALARLMSTFP